MVKQSGKFSEASSGPSPRPAAALLDPPMVHRVHYDALASYHSYELAWLGPIVLPLGLALIAQVIVYSDMLRHRCCPAMRWPLRKASGDPPPVLIVETMVMSIMLAETIFGILCIVSCIINFAQRAYVGGYRVCDYQAFYSTYYVFAGMALGTYGVIFGALVRANRRVSLPLVIGSAIAIHAIALIIAALPLMGAGEYLFAVDFCTMNVEGALFSTLTLVYYVLGLLVIMGCLVWASRARASVTKGKFGSAVPPSRPWVLYIAAAWFAVAWFSVALLALLSFGSSGPVYADHKWAYAVMALLVHSNQLFVPLIFGWFFRYEMHALMAPPSPHETEALKQVAVTPPSLPPSPPTSAPPSVSRTRVSPAPIHGSTPHIV